VNALDPERIAIYYFPLRGLRADEEPVPIAGVLLLEPTFEDWRLLEKTDVADQLLPAAMAEQLGVAVAGDRPPLCLATHIDWPEERDGVHPLAYLDEVEPLVTDVLLALRLLRDDAFLDFEYAGRYVSAPGGLYARAPGPYRQTRVDLEEGTRYTVRPEDVAPLEELALLARSYRELGTDSAGRLAVENLRHAHALNVGDVDRLVFLYVALEALFGGFFERERFGRVPLAERAAADEPTRAWLAGDARTLRNAVAHGNAPSDPMQDEVRQLVGVVRKGLVDYLRFCVALAPNHAEAEALVGARTAASRMRTFNELRARAHEGDESAARLLAEARLQ
jgi:hypothetical protein